jgi:non-specific serine/threonine protein kinase/serine/threonine-protein kinase
MPPERLQRLRAIFDQILDAPPGEREGLLLALTRDEPTLRPEIEALLAAQGPPTDEMQVAAWSDAGFPWLPEDRSGSVAGPYRLEALLGRGGMGEVYRARRDDRPGEPPVAVKLLQLGREGEALVRRFRQEVRILASLHHPGIAALLDSGVSEDGRPYLAMEYVAGEPITVWCERTAPSIRDRVALFRDVCAAVHFAHQNLVIHRDIKPANILVTSAGQAKLLDFGIAKLLAPTDDPLVTTTLSGRALTPSYASPEQVRGESVTTVSDVFSLGVVLYELLTGRRPLALQDLPMGEALERVITEEPVRPSAAVSADDPVVGSRAWRGELAGDLDNIVLKSLRKEPARRYPSAAELSADLERYLAGRLVVARPDTLGYRLHKFVGRHRVGVLATAAVTVVVALGVAGTVSQSQRAAVERARVLQRMANVRELANSLLFEVHDVVADLPGATEARRLILERGIQSLETLAAEVRGNPELEWELAEAYLRTGLVLGDPTSASLGDLAGAEASFQRAKAIAAGLVAAAPRDWRARRTLALVQEKLGDVRAWRGEVAGGVAHAREALALYRSIADAWPDSSRHQLSVAISLVKLGDLSGNMNFPNLEDPERAIEHYQQARRRLMTPLLADAPSWGTRRYMALVDERIGTMHRARARFPEARDAFARSLDAREVLAREEPAHLDARRDLGVTRQNLCEIHLALGEPDPALRLCREALAIYQEQHEADPSNAQGLSDVAIGSQSLAGALRANGELAGALAVLDSGITRIREALAAAPAGLPNRRTMVRLLVRHSAYSREVGRPAPLAREAERRLMELRAEGHPLPEHDALLRELAGATGS